MLGAPGGAVAQRQHAVEQGERDEGQHELLEGVEEELARVACRARLQGYGIWCT